MKKIALLIIIVGFVFVGIGLYEFIKTNANQNEALAEAKSLLEESPIEDNQINSTKEETGSTIPSNFNPVTGETVGLLHIPKLEADIAIVEGTDPDELDKGVGHYKGTAYPLQQDQIVLSGHRETVFRRMGELELGDILTIKLPYGDFSYEIVDTYIVSADDRTVIAPTYPNEVLTLTTCYPFNFIGNAPDRYIITAHPVSKNNE
ncbi:class D sortase [Paucisalibacillus sp. EB02]|uniref:class D sortase n=1 Tax=Paucisalibacillus sp. EB02 TaxID=1347087 RepID=UPI0004BBF8A5|nr:class D sortase [Paucisalibacillus sp. EB02]